MPNNMPEWVNYDPWRNEWICSHSVGHYDESNENTVHGCDGCCVFRNFPGQNTSRAEARRKALQMGLMQTNQPTNRQEFTLAMVSEMLRKKDADLE